MKLSIITVNRNNADGLRKTIESVVSQTYPDFEYIIIDGASTDGSVEVIKEYADRITCWVSEPDKGIYNAMNKGILMAKGEYLLFLNSGDWLVDKEVVKDVLNDRLADDIVSGNLFLCDKGNQQLREAIKTEDLGFEHLYNNRMPHPSTFIKKLLFDKSGMYNEEFKIVSDWEFFLRCLIINNCTYSNIERTISCFDLHGISSKSEYMHIQNVEKEITFKKYVPRIYKSYKLKEIELEDYRKHEEDYREYMNLKNGKYRYVIKFLLYLKSINKKS